MAKIDEDSRGLPISETLFLGSCSSCLHSQKCKCFFSACAVISAFSRWIVAWILHLHACFNPHWCKETIIWYGLTNDACNPGSIWCCWNRVVFASIFFWFDWNTTYAANSKYDTHQMAVLPRNLSNLIKSANCIQLYPHGCGLIHPRSTFKYDQVICNVNLDVSRLFLSNSILAVES